MSKIVIELEKTKEIAMLHDGLVHLMKSIDRKRSWKKSERAMTKVPMEVLRKKLRKTLDEHRAKEETGG